MDQNPKQQVVERIKSANNILVTVSQNPNVDQLSACLGLTLMLNKLGKHATAVFSGQVPSTLEFLQPEDTIETNTDSLRDFIIALDKSKADKLRYKVEDEVVRIFITPYRTSLSEKDLDFSQGDFNVDVVVALGVQNKEDIDQAIVAHGRILHDATVVSVTKGQDVSDLGSINWNDPTASSLSEMLVSISESFQSGLLDPQMSTAFLTGIVSETERFSNEKTTPKVMTMSAQLMAAGANQQLIATELAPPPPEPEPEPEPQQAADSAEAQSSPQPDSVEQDAAPKQPEAPKADGEISIVHNEPIGAGIGVGVVDPDRDKSKDEDEIDIDAEGNLKRQAEMAEQARLERQKAEEARQAEDEAAKKAEEAAAKPEATATAASDFMSTSPHKVVEPLDGMQKIDPLADLAVGNDESNDQAIALPPVVDSVLPPLPGPSEAELSAPAQIEPAADPTAMLDSARDAVSQAAANIDPRLEPVQSLGAQHLDLNLGSPEPASEPMAQPGLSLPNVGSPLVNPSLSVPGAAQPTVVSPVAPNSGSTMAGVADILQASSSSMLDNDSKTAEPDPLAPPPVPPPMMPPILQSPPNHHNSYLNPKPPTNN